MTRQELIERLSIQELQEWTILEQIEPFGEAGEYWRSAMIAAVIANCNRGKHQQPFKAQDFMPKLYEGGRRKQQTVEEQFAFFKRLQIEQNEIMKAREARLGSRRSGRT